MIGAFLFTGLLAITVVLHFSTRVSSIVLFWFAFVLTRPFGATFGDFLTKSTEQGGLDFGTVGASVFFAAVLVVALIKEVKLEKAAKLAEKLRVAIESFSFASAGNITLSMGVSTIKKVDTKDSLLIRADKHLYEAKEGGRNSVVSS
jgi:GGDEF domain-containing protein